MVASVVIPKCQALSKKTDPPNEENNILDLGKITVLFFSDTPMAPFTLRLNLSSHTSHGIQNSGPKILLLLSKQHGHGT